MRDRRIKPRPDMPSGGAQLQGWLYRLRLTQAGGAKLLGVSRVKVNQYVNFEARPSLETAIRLEDIAGIPVRAWLVDDRGGESAA